MNIYKSIKIILPKCLTIYNLSILKKLGEFKIHKLQMIYKLESEVNIMEEVISRHLIKI